MIINMHMVKVHGFIAKERNDVLTDKWSDELRDKLFH